ncbi:MAG: hypothetical protein V2A67_02980 [Bacteroidota bacterium]
MPGRTNSYPPKEQLTGTMFDSRNFDQMKVADNLLFETPGISATFEVRYSSGMVEARINITSGEVVQCILDFNYNELQVLNVISTGINEESTFTASNNWVKINSAGNNNYFVQLLNKNSLPHQLSIRLISNGIPVYQNAVTVHKQ